MTEEEGLNLLGKMVAENVLEVVKLKPFSPENKLAFFNKCLLNFKITTSPLKCKCRTLIQ